MSEETTAVVEVEPGESESSELDEYAGDPPGEDEAPTSARPSVDDDAGEETNAAEDAPAEEKTAEVAEVEEPAFPDELVEQARRIGYDNPESFGTKENLQHAVDQFNQQIALLGRNAMQPAPVVPAAIPVAPVVQAPPVPAAPVEVAQPIPELKEFGDELEPEVREPLNRLMQRHKAVEVQQQGRLDAFQKTVDRLEAQGVQQARMAVRDRVEAFVAGLPKEYAEQLGKEQVGPIAEQVEILFAGYAAVGRDLPLDGDLLMAATRNVLGNKNETIVQKQIASQAQTRQDQATARPAKNTSSRKPSPASNSKEAVDKVCDRIGLTDDGFREEF